jgi:imipenem/basic amino acid-specific outer membrane pore
MKLVKMSLAAALLVSGAYALDNVKVNGSAKLIYQTTDLDGTAAGAKTGLFEKGVVGSAVEAARGGAQVLLGATADLAEGISAGTELQVFSTLGLENVLVSNVMATGNLNVANQWNVSQAWLAASLGKTTVKVGRMELDTPLLFTEKWNVAKNTFEAAVAINTDLPDTTLVGAWVGSHNGIGSGQTAQLNDFVTTGTASTTNSDPFASFAGGAFAAAVVYTGIENATLQAWYYNINGTHNFSNLPALAAVTSSTILGAATTIDNVEAFWLQADVKDVAGMVDIGVQYANEDIDRNLAADHDSDIWAVRVGGKVSDVNLFVAYSAADKDGILGFTNTSTGDKTKIYTGTGSIYMDGIVTNPGNDTWKVGASTNVAGYALAANYTDVDAQAANGDISGWDMSVGTKVVGVNLKAIYTSIDNDTASGFYGNVDRSTLRIIAGLKF